VWRARIETCRLPNKMLRPSFASSRTRRRCSTGAPGASHPSLTKTAKNATSLPTELVDAYRAAVDQAQTETFELALRTLQGANPEFPMSAVLALLELAGWTDALRDFKLQTLDHSGREEVMSVANQGRRGGGRIRRAIFRRFKGALNAALDSLAGIPGVAAIKELKDFLGGAQGD
jgi:hypothetical protein